MAVSPTDPLRVYAAFYGPLGIYRSDDGTSTWSFLPIPGAAQVRRVLVDPFDAGRVYAGADSGFYTSTDGGDHWTGTGWNLPPSSPSGSRGHGGRPLPRRPSARLFRYRWRSRPAVQQHRLRGVLASRRRAPGPRPDGLHCIAFDPATPGTVYFATNGVYKSTDSGATWQRIDDPKQPGMAANGDITIATHPQHMVAVEGQAEQLYRSVDGGATWQKAESLEPGGVDVFVDGDSTRLYRATGQGLLFSGDAGDSWEPAAGVLGQIQTTALGYADADGHTILYAATNGGDTGTASGEGASRQDTHGIPCRGE